MQNNSLPKLLGILALSLLVVFIYINSTKEAPPSQEAVKAATDNLSRFVEAAAQEGIIKEINGLGTTQLELLVGLTWYTIPAESKMKTLETISGLHKQITGHHVLKARDYTSGRMVGEVNSLGTIKLY